MSGFRQSEFRSFRVHSAARRYYIAAMHYRMLDTALGPMAIGWTDAGISRVLLPGDTAQQMRARLEQADGVEAADGQPEIATRVLAYAEGTNDNFADVVLDLSRVPEVSRRIYEHIRGLAWGETTTYGAIARWLGDVALSRAVGAAMGANPIPLIVPCHRVLAADGRTGGFSSPGGVRAKMEMLALEKAASPTGQFSFGF
ncbi:methylated-DNA--[protein]-cysteine S-methyltransferase [Devosia sp.]|uniref:methylated-DNA--[protein]-cysteine S-methyltransferase n=1 Tax=Devosia sp. TaxID=1871048 RepID=UPI002DDD1440|nr:methylated-DNA--[protein]-cysteine S-methyltransferase [Devosia sp.]